MLIMPSFKKSLIVEQFQGNYLKLPIITGAQPKAGTGLKMQDGPFFQRYIVRDISLTEIYRWLIENLSAILKRTRHGGQSRERL